ncbi:MAG: DUF1501 domain-containing protein [Anaerolineae bacterium]|nr:DUF1501 domain-containing protein [Anaerolineae bacterium]
MATILTPKTVISRRNAVKQMGRIGAVGLSKALFPGWMPRLAFRKAGAPGDVLVAIFLRGGMDGLSVIVPYAEGATYYDRRPTIGIHEPNGSDSAVLDLDGYFGMHPSLRPLKDIYDAGSLAVIHAVGSPNPTRSHFDAMELIERGTPMDKSTPNGWIGRHLESAAWQNDSPFRAIGMGSMLPTSLRGANSALAMQSIADFHLNGREDQLRQITDTLSKLYTVEAPTDMLTTQAADVFSTMSLLQTMSAVEYTPENGAEYPDSDFGMGLKQIAQLIKAGVGLEVGCVDLGGWDMHDNQGGVEEYSWMSRQLTELSSGLAAFYADLGEWMSNVSVVTMSEFGRRVEENASHGTDHGRASCMFVMGGGIKGGMYAKWPGLTSDALDDGDLAVTTDYRDVIAEVLANRVLNPALDQVFPNYTPNFLGLVKAR